MGRLALDQEVIGLLDGVVGLAHRGLDLAEVLLLLHGQDHEVIEHLCDLTYVLHSWCGEWRWIS